MRFRKGSKVEVFCGSEGPHGTWRGARIVEGNGHNYHVAYDWCVGVMKAPVTERVSRKLLRPCPPPLEGERDWVAGDVVEVFDGMSWKVGIVSKVTGEVSCLVKLLGTAKEIRVHKSDIRARQIWKEDKWVMAGSGPEACEDGRFDSRSLQKTRCKVTGKCGKRKLHEEDEFLFSGNNVDFKESRMVSSRNLKRGSPCGLDSRVACTRVGQKARALEKQGGCQRLVAEHASLLPEKGQSWRLVHLASKGLKMVVKFTPTKCRQWNIICVQISTYEILMDIFCFITSLTPISRLAVVFKYLHVRCHHDLVKALLLVDACKVLWRGVKKICLETAHLKLHGKTVSIP